MITIILMPKQYRNSMAELDQIQKGLSLNRWHKVMGDSVWDDVKVKEIPIEDALVIADGLNRGNRGDGRSVANTKSQLAAHPGESDALAVTSMNKGIQKAYHGVNNINNPTARFETGGGGTAGV